MQMTWLYLTTAKKTNDLLCMYGAQGGLRINGKKIEAMVIGNSKRPGVGFGRGRGRGRECPNFAGAGNWPFWNLAGAGAGAGAVNLINPRPS